jgi:predicted metal-dependent hydrolase
MVTQIALGEITVDVVRKDIKNLHLSVYPPAGRVRISAPLRMSLDTIRVFAISKLGWIKQQQKKLREQLRETPREYLDRESHYLGKTLPAQSDRRQRSAVSRTKTQPHASVGPSGNR